MNQSPAIRLQGLVLKCSIFSKILTPTFRLQSRKLLQFLLIWLLHSPCSTLCQSRQYILCNLPQLPNQSRSPFSITLTLSVGRNITMCKNQGLRPSSKRNLNLLKSPYHLLSPSRRLSRCGSRTATIFGALRDSTHALAAGGQNRLRPGRTPQGRGEAGAVRMSRLRPPRQRFR